MTIDIEREQVIPLRDAPKHCPGRPHISAIYRWIGHRDNPLETLKCGGRRFTSVEALRRFIARCSGDESTGPTSQPSPNRRHQIAKAEKELADAGI